MVLFRNEAPVIKLLMEQNEMSLKLEMGVTYI